MGWLRTSGWLRTLMFYLHKPSYKKKNNLKYFILTVPLPWRHLGGSVKVKKILRWCDGIHFTIACLSYFEIRVLTATRNVTLISPKFLCNNTHVIKRTYDVISKKIKKLKFIASYVRLTRCWNQFFHGGVQCHIVTSSAN